LRVAWQETTLAALCALSVVSVGLTHGVEEPAALLWMLMLTVQSLPYLATVATASLSAAANARSLRAGAPQTPPRPELREAA
jgi:hypothetical protein